MSGTLNTVLDMMKKVGYLALQYAYTSLYWVMKSVKIQAQSWQKCGAQKKLERAYSGLGGEVYALNKQGETDWARMPSVQQQLKNVEEVEATVFQVGGTIKEINNEFLSRKEEIREKYSAKRADVDAGHSEDL